MDLSYARKQFSDLEGLAGRNANTKMFFFSGTLAYAASTGASLCDEIERLCAHNAALLAACRQAHTLVDDEDNNPKICEMAGSFGLLANLNEALRLADDKK